MDVVVNLGFHVRFINEGCASGEVFWLSRGLPGKVPMSGGKNAPVGKHQFENILRTE